MAVCLLPHTSLLVILELLCSEGVLPILGKIKGFLSTSTEVVISDGDKKYFRRNEQSRPRTEFE